VVVPKDEEERERENNDASDIYNDDE